MLFYLKDDINTFKYVKVNKSQAPKLVKVRQHMKQYLDWIRSQSKHGFPKVIHQSNKVTKKK